ncbi:hypothetical protein J1N35_005570 [Gossypium stocksii]|uniref:Uncharacterized protein n=1 Tax=Gossypium stocksii TaxID=47602 RepID=A0A9D3WFJ5_9ROSI|nr:hypothetical protein J1N35_005570 [Gossypium stocksii]
MSLPMESIALIAKTSHLFNWNCRRHNNPSKFDTKDARHLSEEMRHYGKATSESTRRSEEDETCVGHPFILKRGFDPSPLHCKEVWNIFRFHRWMNFAFVSTTPSVIPVVLKFYSNLKISNKNKVYVRHKVVNISLHAIINYYGVPHYERDEFSDMDFDKFNNVDMDAILAYLTEGSSDLSKGIATEEEVEEEEDKAMEDDDFACYHVCTTIYGGPIIRELSNQPRLSSKKLVIKGKRKRLAGPS